VAEKTATTESLASPMHLSPSEEAGLIPGRQVSLANRKIQALNGTISRPVQDGQVNVELRLALLP
jgi:hypothetical protein